MDEPAARPGPRERHLLRQLRHPGLFPQRQLDEAALIRARREDYAQAAEFMEQLRTLVVAASELKSHSDSEPVLALKGRLDHAYTVAAGLGGDQEATRLAIRRLVEVIMRAVWTGAGDDPQARRELEEEALAREHHYRLLDHPLVADLMLPQSPVAAGDLVPTLLTESTEAVEAALWLFEPAQMADMASEARTLLTACAERGAEMPDAWVILRLLEGRVPT
jgi:hypothetical protein